MTLHVLKLHAENYKRLKAVTITPEGNLVFIAGRNAQGKSSVLDAIWAALAGGEASRATHQPIRAGQDMAVVRLDLGEYIVTRRWTDDDAGTLTVETPPTTEGMTQRYSSPQRLLDSLLGKRAFDPLAFTRLSAKDQVAALLETVTLPFDPATLDRERAAVFEERTDTNRAIKVLEGQLLAQTKPADDTPAEETSAADLMAEYQAILEHNAKGERLATVVATATAYENRLQAEVTDLETKLTAARRALSQATEAVRLAVVNADTFEPKDPAEVHARMGSVEEQNARVRAAAEYNRIDRLLAARRDDAGALTARLNEIDRKKADALAAVTFPLPGLSFNEEGVLFNGIVLSQASSAEQLRVSAAIAMATHPELRLMQIKDGSLLDTDSLAVLAELAADNEFQVWIEVVDESGQVGITIEDGEVKA